MPTPFDDLVALVAQLRGPNGCPWDRKQTHETLKPYLVEEAYEVLEALDKGDSRQLREELGDLLLQVLLHSELEEEQHRFSMNDVITALHEKLIRRHPHVFGALQKSETSLNANQVVNQWEKIKQSERSTDGRDDSILEGVPPSLPALLRAYQLQKRASRVGFDWEKPEHVLDKLNEELQELREATDHHRTLMAGSPSDQGTSLALEAIEQEFGDVLFTIANLSRYLHINPEEALRKTCNRFEGRFKHMEQLASKSGKGLQELTSTEWESYWSMAKQQEQASLSQDRSSWERNENV
ncbi:nucleoside triphosphate pyrophosphohydrolase [Candidatus Nitronereus thalassa]|uniref:Nucleoside triphosphate pyrophosphohydrolase n=1 Tax=Candidatus Nitronereus thalassa TaxID=3020898 RepID=A0ABU3K4B0_9BACT|nr:nucleoside triphosphate pyrophosphohydrolase [Candidatus Nitronereus thalassa]MDT7041230.1 nucleoside triphosphate pyrophosphohydrolase [Candidatus Nitronereus thalassa]